jgi:hypothetical protein
MVLANKVIDENGQALMTDFGPFYPTGHLVAAFHEAEDAHRVLQTLLNIGEAFAGSFYMSASQMTHFAKQNLADAGVIAALGTSLTTVQSFLDAAKNGASFLILTTPDDETAEQAMQTIRQTPFLLAERYHLLAIETMK